MNIADNETENINLISVKAEATITANLAMNAADKLATEAMKVSNIKKDVVEQIKDLIASHVKMYELHKQHTKNLKELLKLIKNKKKKEQKEQKEANKEAKKEAKKKAKKNNSQDKLPITLTGLTRPMSVKKELCDFLHKPLDTKMSMMETETEVHKYIKKHTLTKEKENKMFWIPDETLLAILSPLNEENKETGYSYLNLQRYISHLFIKE